MLKKIGIAVVVLLVIVLGLAATKPDTFVLERDVEINSPRALVFPLVSDFHKWPQWSPWEKLDPNMKRTYSGAPSGVGSIYEWAGNGDAGAGTMHMTKVLEPSNVEIKLDFTKPLEANNMIEFDLDSTAGGTHVTWKMHGPNNFFSKIMTVFVSMDKMVGPDFEKGLANLKTEAEKR